jgi:hypothetical protein
MPHQLLQCLLQQKLLFMNAQQMKHLMLVATDIHMVQVDTHTN